MTLPFSTGEFFANLAAYNQGVWPAQVGLLALGVFVAVHLLRSPHPNRGVIGNSLAVLWLWMGAVYHLTFFSRVNPAARFFALVFIIQAVLLAGWGLRGPALGRRPGRVARWQSVAVLT